MKVTLHRNAHFNAAHRLHNPSWTDEQNIAAFGMCNNPNFHGHNYELTVSITGDIDPHSGYVMNLSDLKNIIKTEVLDYLDHRNLSVEIPEFQDQNPSLENIIVLIWNRLRAKIDKNKDLSITLYETPRNFATYSGN